MGSMGSDKDEMPTLSNAVRFKADTYIVMCQMQAERKESVAGLGKIMALAVRLITVTIGS